jgi:hypothetical protein
MSNPESINVYYEIIQLGDDPIVDFISIRKAGLGILKSKMIYQVTEKYQPTHDTLTLIQADDLSQISRQQGLWDKPNLSARHLDAIANIVECHTSYSVPIRYTVSLISQLLDIDITDICDKAGVHRNYLNNTLKGIHTPTDKVVNVVSSMLGFNPWEFAEWKEIEILNTEIISIKQAEAIINH